MQVSRKDRITLVLPGLYCMPQIYRKSSSLQTSGVRRTLDRAIRASKMRFTTIDSKLAHNSGTVSKWFPSPSIRYPSCDIMVLNIKRMLYYRVNVLHCEFCRAINACIFCGFQVKKVSTLYRHFQSEFYRARMNIDCRTVSLRKLNSIVG